MQCRQLDISQLTEKHMGLQSRSVKTGRKKQDALTSDETAETQETNEKVGRSEGGGGFRDFQRLTHSNNTQEVARLWNQLKLVAGSEVMEKCLRDGSEATKAWREGTSVGSTSFGPSMKEVKSIQRKRIVEAQLSAQGTSSIDDKALVDQAIDSARAGGENVSSVLSQIVGVRRQLHAVSRQSDNTSLLALERFRQEKSEAYRNVITQDAPIDFKAHLQTFEASPPPATGVSALSFRVSAVGDLAADMCSYCDTIAPGQGNMMRSVEATWSHLHRELDGSESGDSSEADVEQLDGCCLEYGMCICDGEGAKLWTMRNRFLRVMKDLFNMKHKDLRELLGQGRIFVHLKPSMPVDTDEAESAELAELWGLEEDHRYFHISDQCFKPYDPFVETAKEATDAEALGAAKGLGEIALKVLT